MAAQNGDRPLQFPQKAREHAPPNVVGLERKACKVQDIMFASQLHDVKPTLGDPLSRACAKWCEQAFGAVTGVDTAVLKCKLLVWQGGANSVH